VLQRGLPSLGRLGGHKEKGKEADSLERIHGRRAPSTGKEVEKGEIQAKDTTPE